MSADRGRQVDPDRGSLDEAEIDLRELWNALKNRKLLVLGLPGSAALLAAVTVFLLPPSFESRAVIQVGQTAQLGQAGQLGQAAYFAPIERPQDLIERLKQQYRVGEEDPPNPLPRVESVAPVDRRNPSAIIEITARARTPEESQAFLRSVTTAVLEEHRRLFTQLVGIQREERNRLMAAAARMEEDAARLSRQLNRPVSGSGALAGLLLLERTQRLSELNALRGQVAQWDLLLSPANCYETRLILEPTRPLSPVRPRKTLIIVLAGMLGLFAGVFLAIAGPGRSRPRPETT